MKKTVIWNIASSFGVARVFRALRQKPKVLFYHGVADAPDPLIEKESISVTDFCKQMVYLQKHHRVIDIYEFESRFINNDWQGNEVLLTFDDGYKNMLSTGLPILEKFGFPFLLFLTANNINLGSHFPTTVNRLVVLASSAKHLELPSCGIHCDLNEENRTRICDEISYGLKHVSLDKVDAILSELLNQISDEEWQQLKNKYNSVLPLTWDESKQIASNELCTIGSHCLDHICCHESQSPKEVERQIIDSRTLIGQCLGVPCDYLSYPNGNYTDFSNQCVADAGYKLGFSTKRLEVDALTIYNIPRLYVPYDYNRFVYSMVTYPK